MCKELLQFSLSVNLEILAGSWFQPLYGFFSPELVLRFVFDFRASDNMHLEGLR